MSSVMKLKARHDARLQEEKKALERRRNLLVLMMRYLQDSGYRESAEKLQQEAGVSLSKFDLCDNMDLMMVFQDYGEYFELKFGKKPQIVKRVAEPPEDPKSGGKGPGQRRGRRPPKSSPTPPLPPDHEGEEDLLGVGGSAISSSKEGSRRGRMLPGGAAFPKNAPETAAKFRWSSCEDPEDYFQHRLLKPMPTMYHDDPELRAFAQVITREIYQENPNVRWDDVVELNPAKRLLKEAVVMPVKYPELFSGRMSPWKGVLLFGPPGTGKTMLAQAVATECRTTFFNISASSIVSKWRGDSEKLIRVLFDLARYHAPSTVFLDEIDAIMSQRGGGAGGEHEASRRLKTELLVQLDGLAKSKELVFLLAASNLPWELDQALLRRLEKRVYIPIPGAPARKVMLKKHLQEEYIAKDIDFDAIAERTEMFSGADIALLCKESLMRPLRRVIDGLEAESSGTALELGPVTSGDVEASLAVTRPTTHKYLDRYSHWEKEHGSTCSTT